VVGGCVPWGGPDACCLRSSNAPAAHLLAPRALGLSGDAGRSNGRRPLRAGRGRGFFRPRGLGARPTVHGPDGVALPAGPRLGATGGGRPDHVDISPAGRVPRLGPHQGLGGPMEGARGTGEVPGGRGRQAAGDRVRHGRGGLALAGRGRGGGGPGRDAGLARPDWLRRPVRRDAVQRRQGVPPARRPRDAGTVAAGIARTSRRARGRRFLRPGGGRRRHGRHLCGTFGGPARPNGGAGAGPARARRQQLVGNPRLAQWRHRLPALPEGRRTGPRTRARRARQGQPRQHRRQVRRPAPARPRPQAAGADRHDRMAGQRRAHDRRHAGGGDRGRRGGEHPHGPTHHRPGPVVRRLHG